MMRNRPQASDPAGAGHATAELFPRAPVERVAAPGAQLCLHRAANLGVSAPDLLQELIADTPWRSETITLFGKRYRQPRLLAWYGDPDAAYSYSGSTLQPQPWTARLADLRVRMEALAGSRFNSVLLNYYRDHRDSMGLHADDEPELGPRPVIASLSLGEERPFRLRHRHDRRVSPRRLLLPCGSVLIMAGDTQTNWKHELPKLTRPCGPRLNLTFRLIRPR